MSGSLCRHFGTCGGCVWQDMPGDAYRAKKRGLVVEALAAHGMGDAEVGAVVEVSPGTRRRATFKALNRGGAVALGFHAAQSHDIVDMRECRVLTPAIVALVPRLREFLLPALGDGAKADIAVTESASGIEVDIRRKPSTRLATALVHAAAKLKVAHLRIDGDPVFSEEEPFVVFGSARVKLPPDAFLQPTAEGEARLQAGVKECVGKSKSVVDLFAGCGTFSLVLAATSRVHAVESERGQLEALAASARATQGLKPVTTEARDLFRHPLAPQELDRFDAVVLDPPRAGALAQAREIARSKIRRVAYVSCNPQTFARDAAALVAGGFVMGTVTPVDQFLWSSHIELVAGFERS